MTLLVALGVMTGAGDRFLSGPGAPAVARDAHGEGAPSAAPAAPRPVCPYCCSENGVHRPVPALVVPKVTAEARLAPSPTPRPSGA